MARTVDDLEELLDALQVTSKLTGTDLDPPSIKVMLADLSVYPKRQVLGALARCRRELKGRLSIAAIVERLDDGRPGGNEAWAMIPQDEDGSVVWTTEMQQAFGVAQPLIAEGQMIAARMAFIETYEQLVANARGERQPPVWQYSPGHDPRSRAAALELAVRKGRISQEFALKQLPAPEREAHANVELLTGPTNPAMPEHVRAQLADLKKRLKAPAPGDPEPTAGLRVIAGGKA